MLVCGGHNTQVYFYMKMLHLFATEYVNDDDDNGLQRLLERFSITNEDNDVPIHPFDARNRMIEISHLHHWCKFDINPWNTVTENRLDNNARKRCSHNPHIECQCPTPCQSCHKLINLEYFDRHVKRGVVEINDAFNVPDEHEIRVELAVEFTRWLARNNITPENDEFPDFLRVENRRELFALKFRELAELRSGIAPPPGYRRGMTTNHETGEKVAYEEVITGLKQVPSDFLSVLSQMRRQAEDLRGVDTSVGELTEFDCRGVLEEHWGDMLQDIGNNINEKNQKTALRSIVAPAYFKRYLNSQAWSTDLGTDDEKEVGALHLTDVSLTPVVQQVKFSFHGDNWEGRNGATYAVNTWVKDTLQKRSIVQRYAE